MKIINNLAAYNFNALTTQRVPFILDRLRGKKILLNFYGAGGSDEDIFHFDSLKNYSRFFLAHGMEVVCVFSSMPKDIFPLTGRTDSPFYALADPLGLLFNLYSVRFDKERFRYTTAAFFIDENFIIRKAHYGSKLTDYLPANQVKEWVKASDRFSSFSKCNAEIELYA